VWLYPIPLHIGMVICWHRLVVVDASFVGGLIIADPGERGEGSPPPGGGRPPLIGKGRRTMTVSRSSCLLIMVSVYICLVVVDE
jgi:hypothetical protein